MNNMKKANWSADPIFAPFFAKLSVLTCVMNARIFVLGGVGKCVYTLGDYRNLRLPINILLSLMLFDTLTWPNQQDWS